MSEMIEIAADPPVQAYLSRPNAEPMGAVIVIHEVWGLVDHIKSVTDRISAEGYIALAPDLLGGVLDTESLSGLQVDLFNPEKRNEVQPKMRELMAPMHSPEFGRRTTARLRACFDYLYDLPESGHKVAVMGFCFGGSYSFNLAVSEKRLKLALPFYGHAEQTANELAKINCPVYAFYGQNDERLVSGLSDLTQRMKEAGVDFSFKVYPDCGHAFFNDSNPYAYNSEAAADAWRIAVRLLSENLIS